MKKNELKKMLKPLIKECIKEVIFEEGTLSTIISEVMKSNGVSSRHMNKSNKRLLIQNILFPNVRLEIFIHRPIVE